MPNRFVTRAALCALSTLLCLVLSSSAFAEPVTAVRNNGPSANRVDIIVLGDGYTAAELASGKYAADVETMLQGLFAQEPYREYRNYYNVRRIDVASPESGADHPEFVPAIYKATALDAAYNCAGTARLICVNTSKVSAVIANSAIPADARELTLVLVNDATYGGSGGAVAVASLHPQTVELVLHEAGHTFALLGDEYGGGGACVGTEPSYPDITVQTVRANIKWTHWIDPATPVPTLTTDPSVPGLYAGGNYCDSGYYRPAYNSKMRSLGVPFYQVNQEEHVLRIHNFVSPIDDASPAGSAITINGAQVFSVTVGQPYTHALTVAWSVDGVPASTGTQFTANLAAGQHTVTATVSDGTPWVRKDSSALLSDVRTWSVTVPGAGPGAFGKLGPASGSGGASSSVTLSWAASSGAAGYEYCVDTSNDGACTAWSNAGTATSVAITGLSAGTSYYWQVRASANGSVTYADGVSTAFWSFTTQVAAPGAFVKSGPAAASVTTTSPSLSWSGSANASAYEYCVDATNDQACGPWVNVGMATSAALTGLAPGTTYYWQVRATNPGGTTWADGAATAFRSFVAQSGTAPSSFVKTAPSNGVTGLPTAPTLTWGMSTGATSYQYCLDTTNDNACTTWVDTGGATSVVLSLNQNTTYYWHVRATNAFGTTYAGGGATAFWSFATGRKVRR